MEGLPSRLNVGHILPHHQAVSSSHYTSIQPQPQEKLPPSYEEAQMAAQSAEIQQMGSFENEKYAIKRHPLFSLLSLLFEKCELATQTGEGPSSASFDNDIRTFVHNQERDGKPFFSDDPELDSVMVKAIQVLRIHLLELEKVNELCKDFCQRYIACLKGKMQSENLLRSPPPAYAQNPSIISITGPQGTQLQTIAQQSFPPQQIQQQPHLTFQAGNVSSVVMPNPSGTVVNTYPGVPPGTTVVVPSTQPPLTPTNIAPGQIIQAMSPMTPESPDSSPTGKRSKRGVLPKSATNIMKTWLFQHLVHPYPTEDEKRSIAAQTNLTILQVNNWFINARRRILQPMLDASNPEGPKAKKPKQQNHPAQRMWPENLAINMSPNQYIVTQGGIPMVHTVQQPMPQGVQIQTIQPLQAVQHTIQQLIPQSTQQTMQAIPQSSQGIPHTIHQGMHIQQPVQSIPHCIQIPVRTIVDSSAMTSPSMITSQPHMQTQSEGMTVVVSPMLNPDHRVMSTLSSSSPTATVHNGNLGNGEHNLVGSPHHLTVQGVETDMSQGTMVGVDGMTLEGQPVGHGIVSR